MNKDEIQEKMKEIVKSVFHFDENTVDIEHCDFFELGYSSVDFISLIISIECTFGIEIPDNELKIEDYCNFSQLIKKIQMLLTMQG